MNLYLLIHYTKFAAPTVFEKMKFISKETDRAFQNNQNFVRFEQLFYASCNLSQFYKLVIKTFARSEPSNIGSSPVKHYHLTGKLKTQLL